MYISIEDYVAESQTDEITTTTHWVNESMEEKYKYVPDDENMDTQQSITKDK